MNELLSKPLTHKRFHARIFLLPAYLTAQREALL
jgi:hypothetical protein